MWKLRKTTTAFPRFPSSHRSPNIVPYLVAVDHTTARDHHRREEANHVGHVAPLRMRYHHTLVRVVVPRSKIFQPNPKIVARRVVSAPWTNLHTRFLGKSSAWWRDFSPRKMKTRLDGKYREQTHSLNLLFDLRIKTLEIPLKVGNRRPTGRPKITGFWVVWVWGTCHWNIAEVG